MKYCANIYETTRFKTREVKVGQLVLGGMYPIRIQSMTTTATEDVEATTEQIIQLADLGCELVRVTVQGKKEAASCEKIKNNLIKKGYLLPLVADIHFYPPAALEVVDFVDKIRINPGNYLDKRATFKTIEYESDEKYLEELMRLEEGLLPLIEKLKKGQKALRIGVNHGSLSDRIMSRYGDNPTGMVESAFEFAKICRKYDFHDIVFSMKASNPLVMINAYRTLVAKMIERGWNYPLHLGVTEAGLGQDGRIKSAIGIGSLLLDGLGDTIRVSLTEDPCREIQPCRDILAIYQRYRQSKNIPFETANTLHQTVTDKIIPYPLHPQGSVLQFYQKDKTESSIGESVDAVYIKQESENIAHKIHKPCLSKHNGPFCDVVFDDKQEFNTEGLTKTSVIFLHVPPFRMQLARKFYDYYLLQKLTAPIILCADYTQTDLNVIIQASMELGALLCDQIGDGVAVATKMSYEEEASLMFNLLQACRKRLTKTEYIACPGCGRTLFPLQEVTQHIQSKTAHLPGVKIAVMGCIVNGPGEMADADFGYVGSKTDHVDLYVGKNCIQKHVPSAKATDQLIELIKQSGRWIDPS